MAKSKIKFIALLCLGLFVVIDVIAGNVGDTLGTDAATVICRERGWHDGELSLIKSNVSGWFLGKSTAVELTTTNRNPPKTIHITLRKPINLLDWRVVDYTEG